MEFKQFNTEIGGRKLIIETGKLAQQANGSVTVKYGDTSVLVTAVISDHPREGINYLPLMVDYEEKLYAAGKIKGSRFIKREGRPTDEAILSGRIIDRTLRPLFNPKIRNDIQIVVTTLSFDGENDPIFPSLIGASLAISISDIPWNGPVGGLLVGCENKKWTVNPVNNQEKKPDSKLLIAGAEQGINMIEGVGEQIPEQEIINGLELAQQEIKNLIAFQEKIIKEFKVEKKDLNFPDPDPELTKEIEKFLGNKLETALYQPDKAQRMDAVNDLKKDLQNLIEEKYDADKEKTEQASELFDQKLDQLVHKNILEKNKRPDDRKPDELRKISSEISVLPRVHGSALFTRGTTQALSTVTLAPPGAEQLLDQMELKGSKRYMHHYNFPPYSVGEVKPLRGPGRREIGHGALAEKALLPLIPSREEFPYTIRVVSEILSSNGSSSMASVCGSTLALLDAGVKLKANAAGIAMGLMLDESGDKYKILTDIQGPEDHHGDMDLKVAGTRKGITAIQMDIKPKGLSLDILKQGLTQAKQARNQILDEMEKVIKAPKPELSNYAPRVYTISVNPKRIGDIIGPGGKMINKITEETETNIDIEDDGTVFVSSEKPEGAKKALSWIKSLTRELKQGEIFQGKVVKVADFGAFIELVPGQEGLLHISELAPPDKKIKDIRNVVHRGDTITVKIKNIGQDGKIGLSLFKKGMQM